jgi:hypothetical protein
MDPQFSAMVKRAAAQWIAAAIEHLKGYPQQMDALKKSMEDVGADVRIIYYIRADAISIEACDFSKRTFTEVFREELAPGGVGGSGNR